MCVCVQCLRVYSGVVHMFRRRAAGKGSRGEDVKRKICMRIICRGAGPACVTPHCPTRVRDSDARKQIVDGGRADGCKKERKNERKKENQSCRRCSCRRCHPFDGRVGVRCVRAYRPRSVTGYKAGRGGARWKQGSTQQTSRRAGAPAAIVLCLRARVRVYTRRRGGGNRKPRRRNAAAATPS